MKTGNSLSNSGITHHGTGLHSGNAGQDSVSFGKVKRNESDPGNLVPVKTSLRNDLHASPYTFEVKGALTLAAPLNAAVKHPSVIFSPDNFGQPQYDPAIHSRQNLPWRLYIQLTSSGAIYFLESIDGITWGTETLLAAAQFPTGATQLLEGFQPFYDEDGIFVVSGVTYPWGAIARDSNLTTGDATDLWAYYSLDGITWLRTAMGNHDVSGDPFVEVAASLGHGAAFLGKTGNGPFPTFAATLPRTFRNAPGDWWALMRCADAPANAGDTVFGTNIMAMNSSDAADWNEVGHFANWKRNVIRQVGELSFGQNTKALLFHVVEYLGMFVGLVQLYYHEGGGAVLIKSGIGLALSKDGLHFDFMGPLYDAGLTHMLNDRTPAVNQTDMDPTSYLANSGDGDGSSITAGSVVVDPDGMNFSGRGGRLRDDRDFLRVYWTEQTSGKVLWGTL